MQCEDNSKLRTPLSEVCQTTDIGCVPITDGKPGCTPQPDELPIAFDPNTATLWLFSCKTREWIPFQKFTMCQLNALNLENITNICDVLNIGVNYAGSGDCVQGTITLKELAERILECLTLETKIVTIGQGEGNKVKISIEGLPLDPVYVTGRNIWSEGGSGTETDPLLVATYDPICKWDIKTQAEVDNANTKHLGACLDGEMSRVPFPPKVCELPSRNQAQVDATDDKELIACLDGEGVKIPYPALPCTYPQMTAEQVQAATDKDIIACVDGQNVKVPVPDNLFEPSICEAPNMTLEESQAAQSTLKLVACKGDGDFSQTVKIPIQGSGLFSYNTDWKYLCVPQTTGIPVGAPPEGTGPLRMDCDNSLWVWDCENSGWRKTKDGLINSQYFENAYIPDTCNNLRFKGWFSNNGDQCVQDVQMTASQLAKVITDCLSEKCHKIYEQDSYDLRPQYGSAHNNDRSFEIGKVNLTVPTNSSSGNGSWKMAIWNCAAKTFELGSGEMKEGKGTFDDENGVGQTTIELYADPDKYDCKVYYDVEVETQIIYDVFNGHNYTIAVVAGIDDIPGHSWESEFTGAKKGEAVGALPARFSQAVLDFNGPPNGYWWINDIGDQSGAVTQMKGSVNSSGGTTYRVTLSPGQSKTIYLQAFVIFASPSLSTINFTGFDFGFLSKANVRAYRGLRV